MANPAPEVTGRCAFRDLVLVYDLGDGSIQGGVNLSPAFFTSGAPFFKQIRLQHKRWPHLDRNIKRIIIPLLH
jgi:hypothetical protein